MDVSEDTKKDGSSSSSTMFMWRIQSFSTFSKLKLDKHYSGVFSAGGFNWRLLVYPKGNNADGFLSLYLELVDSLASPSSSSSSGCSDIFVDYTLSLLDQSSFCQHRTISGTWERFNANRRCVGFESFIPLSDFNSPSKGYLVEDTCLFQAKLTIHGEGTTNVVGNWVCLTLEEAIPTRFSWKIDEFSKLAVIIVEHKSELFTAGNYKWNVLLYPKENSTQAESLSLFLGLAESDKLSPDREVYAEYSLSLVDQLGSAESDKLSPDREVYAEYSLSLVDQIQRRNTVIKTTKHWFHANAIGWGWPRYIALSDFNDPTKGFLINDTCIIEAEISVPRIVNYCSVEPKKQKSCERCCLAEARDSPPCKFSWSIDKFSQLNKHEIRSEVFTSEGYKWRLLLFPRGKYLDQLSLYLEVVESENLPSGWRIYAQFKLTVINSGNGALTTTKDGWHQFYAQQICWGFREFMPLSVLFDKSRSYLTDDKLQVEAEVTVHRGLDYWMYCSREVTGYVGLNGSSSPLNCYLQILYHIPFFRKAVLHVLGSGSYESSLNIIPAMRHLFQKLESSGICVSSNHFNRHFGYNAHGSSIWRDMHEMIRTLFRELEAEIRGKVIGDQVKQLFAVEFTKSLDCFTGNSRTGERRFEMISENYNSKRESFCDLLLDVKGCRDVYSSFDLILREDKLDVTPKYCSKQQTSQDASNGVLFVKFPPILQLVLKRFEFDNLQNTTVKIDDLYMFPFQLDLDRENGKYLSSDTVGTIRNLYTLHSIVVHKGSLHGGHFYCLIRPNLTDQWLKFEDGKVTKEDLNLLSENLCSRVGEAICSNVCMLVYIREGDKELIFTSDAKVDFTKMASFDNGWKEPESKKKNRSDEFMYRIIKVSQHKDFTYQIGKEIYFDLVDHENVCSFRVRKDMPFIRFKDELAKEFGIDVQFQRFWLWSMHPNGMYRPCRLLTPQEELQSIGMLGEMINILVDLNLFLDVELGPDLIPIPPLDRTEDDILLFFKLYDPRIEELRYVGRLYVKASDKPVDILVKLNNMARLTDNEEIDLFKEAGFEPTAMCEHVDKERTFRDNMLKDGSIICYQSTLPIEERNRCLHPDVHSFLKFVRGHPMWDRKRCAKMIEMIDERDALLFHAQKVISDLTIRAGGSVGSWTEGNTRKRV